MSTYITYQFASQSAESEPTARSYLREKVSDEKMEHKNLENALPTTLMLPKESDEKVVIITPHNNGVGKILIREDTILAGLQGCAGCGKARFTCSGVKNQWSVLCWGRQSDKKYYTLLTLLSATFVLSVIGTIFFCFTNTINDAILSNMVIRNNSLAYKVWKRPNVQPLMKVHIFNYTNWREVREGLDDKLHVVDVGPYVYSQQVERVNVEFDKDRITFQEKNDYHFLPNKSNGAPFDQLTVPNMPLLGLAKVIEMNLNPLAQFPVLGMLPFANHPEAFVQLPLHRFLWGYEDSIYNAAKPLLSLRGELKVQNFGLLAAKNKTLSEKLTINTGEVDMDKMNLIEKVEGDSELRIWSGECNSIKATDGSIFPPSQLAERKLLYVFYPNLCRRLPFRFEKEVELDGIPLLRYRLPVSVFDDPAHNPDNQCYCEIDTATCPPKGVINVTSCVMGAPALASFPHFSHGDSQLRSKISGLHPDGRIHENYLDIHPTLGIALRGKSSLQINMQVSKSTISQLGFLEQGLILPVAWIEMAVEDLPESLRTLIYHGTFSTAAAQLGLAVMSVAALIVSGICLLMLLVGRRPKPCATVKIPIDTEMNQHS